MSIPIKITGLNVHKNVKEVNEKIRRKRSKLKKI